MANPIEERIKDAIRLSKKGSSHLSVGEIMARIDDKQAEKRRSMPLPMPNLDVTETTIIEAEELIRSGHVFVRYIRSKKALMEQENEQGHIKHSIVPGVPLACMVAFMDGIGLRVGWSVRNNSKAAVLQNVRGEVIEWENTEPIPYTKKYGVKVAVLRALLDKIHIETERTYKTKTIGNDQSSDQIKKRFICFDKSGKRIHETVSKALPNFIRGCQLWFQQNNQEEPVNVSHMGTVKNIEQPK